MPHGKPTATEALTDVQDRFVQEYIKDLSRGAKSRAAIAAGIKPKFAGIQASRWLRQANVQAKIAALKFDRETMARVTQARIIREYELIAFADPKTMYDETGNLLPVPEMPEDMRRIIAGFDVEVRVDMSTGEPEIYSVKKVKMADKKGALDALAKWRDMFPRTGGAGSPGSKPPAGQLAVPPGIKAIINLTVLPPDFQFPKEADGE